MAEFTGILYRKAGGTTELNRSVGGFCAIESATLEDRWQDGGTIDLSVVTSGTMVFYDGDYVVVKGRPYEIRETISEYTAIDDTRNRYAIKLHYPDIRFKRAIMYNTVEQEDGGVFSWMRPNNTIVTEGSFQTLVETCCYNANEVANERVFKIGTINEDIETDFRVLSFSDTNCWATLKQICEEWNTFYTIRANTDVTPDSLYIIDFGAEPDPFPETISIGKNKGISELKLNYSDSDVYTQFIVLGSTENLPSAYPNERLQLDTDLEATPPVYDYSMIVANDKYAQWGRKRMELVYEYIKPTRTGTITGLPENNIFAFYDTDLATVLAEEPTWNPVGGTVHVVEGPLLGYTFEIIGWHAATYKITIKQISDSNGLLLPNEDEPTFRFTDGTGGTAVTKYNLADIPLPTSYVTDARTRLKERAVTVGIPYWSQPRASFSLSVDPFFTRNKEVELSCGMLIPIVHPAMSINKSIRIKRISYNLLKDKYFDVESVEVSDIEQDNYMNSVHKDVQRTISTIKTAGYVTPSVTKQNNLTTLYNSIVSGYGFISYDDFIKWCANNQGIMIQALEGEVGSEELVHIINADLLRVNDAFANRILANEVFIGGVEDTAGNLVNNYLLHLTSQVATVACDSEGTVTGTLPTSTAIVYHGASADTGWSFSGELSGCTGSVNEGTGVITITGLTADDSTVTVSATKADKPTLQATFRISKVYAGVDGADGEDGVTTYTWIKYADVADGTGLYDTPTANTLYIGIAVNKTTPTESTTKTDYTWSKFKGDQGVAGDDGATTYTWIKYGTSSAGAGITDDPTGMTYIGFAYNKTTPTESTTPGDYTWSLIKGTDGVDGADGEDGVAGADGVGLTGTTIEYAVSSSGTTAPTSGWQSTPPAASAGQFMWTKTVWSYSDSTSETGYSVGKIGDTGATGQDGLPGAPGADGDDAVYYYLTPSVDAVIRSMDGTATPSTVSCAQYKIQGGGTPVAANKTIKYQRSIDGTMQTYSTAVAVSPSIYIDFYLYDGVTELWRTRDPVLHDLDEWESTLNDFAKGIGYADGGGTSAYEKLVGAAGGETTIIVGGYLRTALIEAGSIVAGHIHAGTITANEIKDSTITGGKIALATITAANIYGGTITATEIANSTITGGKIALTTIEAANIKDSTITGGKIALATIEAANIKDATITGGKIALTTIEASNIKDATITGGKIAATTIDASNIKNSTITGGKIASATITAANIYGGTITATEIANATITGGKIASATITAANIYGGTITATEIADSTITGAKIATSTITATNIYGGTITATEIANSTITGGKIALATIEAANIKDATITGGKIALTTITAANIYGGTITATEIANSTITGAKIASGTIEATNIKDSTITGGKIANTTITNANIVDSTIKAAKIDVADLIATSAFIDNLTVKKLATAIDDDGTSVSVSKSASGGRAGVVLSGPSSNGAKISYTGGAAVVSVYDATNTLQMADGYFIAYRSGMSASIGVSSLGAELSVTSSSYSARLKPTDLYVGGLPSTSQTSGHFWRDSNGIVRCGAQGLNFVIGTGSDTSTIYFSTT